MMLYIPADLMTTLIGEASTQIPKLSAHYENSNKSVAEALEKTGAALKKLSP